MKHFLRWLSCGNINIKGVDDNYHTSPNATTTLYRFTRTNAYSSLDTIYEDSVLERLHFKSKLPRSNVLCHQENIHLQEPSFVPLWQIMYSS